MEPDANPVAPSIERSDTHLTLNTVPRESVGAGWAIALAVLLTGAVVSASIFRNRPDHWVNDWSRWNSIGSLVEHGRYWWYAQDSWGTIDACTYDDQATTPKADVRWYSSKPPFMQVVVAGLAWPICRVCGLDYKADFAIVGRALLLLVNVVPLMVFIALFGRWLVRVGASGFVFVISLAAAAGGTYLTGYAVTLNNHILGGFCAFFSLYALYSIGVRERSGGIAYAVAGFFAGMAAAFEMPAAALAGLGFAYVLLRDRRRALTWYLAAVAIPIIAFYVTNRLCIGRWAPFQATFPEHYHKYWQHPGAMDALAEPKRVYFFHLTLGHHGFFSLMPVLLIGLIGLVRHLAARDRTMRLLAAITAVATVVVVGFYVFKTNNYAGGSQGPRWLFWLIPLWLIMLPGGLDVLLRRQAAIGRTVAVTLLSISVFSAAYCLSSPWTADSWLHTLYRKAGVINYGVPTPFPTSIN